jgi:putative peptidoglycan lipid II flippase
MSNEALRSVRTTLFRRNVIFLLSLSGAAVMGAIAVGEPLLSLMTNGGIGTSDGPRLAIVLLLLGGVPVMGAAGSLVAAAFYAAGDTRTPTLVSVASFSVFVVARIIAFEHHGVYGLCAAISAYFLCNILILGLFLLKRARPLGR